MIQILQLQKTFQRINMPKIPVPKLRKTRVRAFNPTLSMIREEVKESPEVLRKRYNPYMIDKPGEGRQPVYKSSIDIVLELHSVSIVVTNTPYTCFGSNYSHIKDFKRYQDVTFPDSLVCIAYSEINKPEAELKPFCMDIPAFLHMFSHTDELLRKINTHARDLADQWTRENFDPSMKGKRNADDRQIFLDYRQNSKCAGVSEIVMCGTSFNFTLEHQDEDKEITCEPEDIMFQLRYQTPKQQTSDGKARPKTKQIVLSADSWNELLRNDEFIQLYNEVWNKYPLPQIYSERLEQYTILNTPEEGEVD